MPRVYLRLQTRFQLASPSPMRSESMFTLHFLFNCLFNDPLLKFFSKERFSWPNNILFHFYSSDSKNREVLKEAASWVFSFGMARTHKCDFFLCFSRINKAFNFLLWIKDLIAYPICIHSSHWLLWEALWEKKCRTALSYQNLSSSTIKTEHYFAQHVSHCWWLDLAVSVLLLSTSGSVDSWGAHPHGQHVSPC